MYNTYWTKIDQGYYRVHNGILKYAPLKENDSSIDLDNITEIKNISEEELDRINLSLGSRFKIDEFNE